MRTKGKQLMGGTGQPEVQETAWVREKLALRRGREEATWGTTWKRTGGAGHWALNARLSWPFIEREHTMDRLSAEVGSS
jgi:hypothetical protein